MIFLKITELYSVENEVKIKVEEVGSWIIRNAKVWLVSYSKLIPSNPVRSVSDCYVKHEYYSLININVFINTYRSRDID